MLTTIAWKLGSTIEYALEGSVFVGGAVVSWLRDGLGIIKSSADVQPLADTVPDSDGVLLVPAFTGLGAPHWDPYARGTIVGITRGTKAAHIARAALDSIAFQVADLADAMRSDAGGSLVELRVDGGASVNDTLLQLQADFLQLPVVRPKVTETTALGAAYLAGLATGVWKDRGEVADHWQIDRRFEPKMSADQAAKLRAAGARRSSGRNIGPRRNRLRTTHGNSAANSAANASSSASTARASPGTSSSSAAARRAWASPSTPRRAATASPSSSSTTSAKAPPAAAPSSSTAASAISQQGNVGLVREALHERGRLCQNAPHLVHPLPTIVPLHSQWEGIYYGIGLKVYDLLSGRLGLGPSRRLSLAQTLAEIPTLETAGLCGGIRYLDGAFDDARLLVNLVQTAIESECRLPQLRAGPRAGEGSGPRHGRRRGRRGDPASNFASPRASS